MPKYQKSMQCNEDINYVILALVYRLEEMSSRAESQSDIIRAHDRLESELNTSRTLLQNLQGELERERCRFESTSMELVSSQKMCMEARKEVETECKRNRELESELNRSSSR